MKVLFISKHKYPHIGGVEKHIKEVGLRFETMGYGISLISEEDIKQPQIRIIGLLYIWYWLFKNIKLIKNADIIHVHDVFIWYLPFKLIFPNKKVYITFHGWEGRYPIPLWNILNKKVANKITNGSIAVGKYIEKYYGVKSNYIIYGGVSSKNKTNSKKFKNTIVWLGRQDSDTGFNEFKKWLEVQPINYKVKYVTNDPNPEKYLKTADFCVPSGYLSHLEAKNYGCKILTFANNPLKTDYWNETKLLKDIPTWDEVVNVYLKLWKA